MISLVSGAAGLVMAGPLGAMAGAAVPALMSLVPSRERPASVRAVLLVVLVELRSGSSVLAALLRASAAFPEDRQLSLVTRIASINGLSEAAMSAPSHLAPFITQMARSQKTGSSVTATVRSLLESDIATNRARKLARARTLPVRLMVPIALLLLPGLLLMFWAPGLISLIEDIGGPFSRLRTSPRHRSETGRKGETMFLQRKWISRVREEKGQGTVEYFLVILAATALAFVGLNWLQGDDGGGLIEGLFGNVIDWVMNMF